MPVTYFNISGVEDISAYILLLDIMGTQNIMSSSITTSSNFIFKFHSILELNKEDTIAICPIMDGAYIGTNDAAVMKRFISNVFKKLSDDFIEETDIHHKYIVRGSLAYGKVVFGKDIPSTNFDNSLMTDPGWESYRSSLIIGHPLIQTHSVEGNAPPFGIFIHESVSLSNFFEGFNFIPKWYKWWNNSINNTLQENFCSSVEEYFEGYKNHSYSSGYDYGSLEKHLRMFYDYIKL